jgi:hypothetical protein
MHEPTFMKAPERPRSRALLALPFLLATIVVACDSRHDGPQGSGDDGDVPAPGVGISQTPPPTEMPPSAPPQGSAPTGAPPEDPGPPAIQFIGRFDERDPAGPKAGWPGTQIVANFDGTHVSVRLSETPYLDGPSEWDVAIDGQLKPKMVLAAGDHVYELASGLPAGPHRVELYKRTEGQNGVTQFLGYDFHGGTLLPPPLRLKRRLEIIGDSDVTGFGYEGASLNGACAGTPVWAAHWENFRQAWGQRVATKLKAELHGTAYSGKGWYYNIWRPDDETIGIVFPRAEPTDPTSVYDLAKWTPDAVVVAIGGNDYNIGLPEDFGPPPLAGVIQKVRDLTGTLRTAYPKGYIFLMAYAVLTDTDPPGRNRRTNIETALKTVRDERLQAGDTRIAFVAPPQYDPDELIGCDGHGGPAYHERIAKFLEAEIATRLGW